MRAGLRSFDARLRWHELAMRKWRAGTVVLRQPANCRPARCWPADTTARVGWRRCGTRLLRPAAAAAAGAGQFQAASRPRQPASRMDGLQLYLQEEGPAAAGRVRHKILTAGGLAAAGSTVWAVASQRRLIRTVPALTANTAIVATTFAVCQEAVRAARAGESDAWNSFAAGALSGALVSRAAHGRGFYLLGVVAWAPLCGAVHWVCNELRLEAALQHWLARQGLLDLPPHLLQQQVEQQDAADATAALQAQQHQQQQAQLVPPRRVEELTHREKRAAVEAIKQRELEQLHAQLRQQEEAAQQQARTSGRRGWFG